MREVNNDLKFGKVQNTDLKSEKIDDKLNPQFCGEIAPPNIKDFSNPQEVLGRSQVNTSDNLTADIAFAKAHTHEIMSADKFFDIAYAQFKANNEPDAYEKASAIATIYAKELT